MARGLAYDRSLFRLNKAGGLFRQDFDALFPIGVFGQAFLDKGLVPIRGGIRRVTSHPGAQTYHNLDSRWSTLTVDEVKWILKYGMAQKTITEIRIISDLCGNPRGVGTEDGYVVELTGSEEAEALAVELGVNYTTNAKVGNYVVPHTNAFMFSLKSAVKVVGNGLSKISGMEKEEEIPSRMDDTNPTLQQLIAHLDATGTLPVRERQTPGNVTSVEAFDAIFA